MHQQRHYVSDTSQLPLKPLVERRTVYLGISMYQHLIQLLQGYSFDFGKGSHASQAHIYLDSSFNLVNVG